MKIIMGITLLFGFMLILYGVIGKFVGSPAVGFFGMAEMSAGSAVLAGDTLLLLAIALAICVKK
ncbi:MAG: hypothetical protein PHT53_07535 [Candidatus Omnitrophica bacterium]|nr:hypothetical protein [Candidatus Omnitrophota bacterium]